MKIADLSHYQGNIDWEKANKDLELIIFRASVGLKPDNKYLEYVTQCSVPFGAYHYLKAGTAAEAIEEAKFFYTCATTNNVKPLFFCADIEHSTQNTSNVEELSTVFADTLQSLGAQKLGLYIGQTLYSYANKDKYDFIWIPRYGKNTGEIDVNYAPIYPCDLWQYTSVGHVDGIDGNVDLNTLYGNKTLEWFTNKEGAPMSERFTNTHFVEFLKGFVGQPYWYGTCVYKCSESLLDKKKAQNPAHYTPERMAQYKENIAANMLCSDCSGLAKGYIWTNGGEGVLESIGQSVAQFKNIYGSNGLPDKSANGMFDYAKSLGLEWGTIDTMPDIPGLAVRYDGHVGYYIGDGKVVEERGFAYGCVITELKKRPWLHWYKYPVIKYVTDANSIPTTTINLGDRLLKKGSQGDDVKELQRLLNGYLNTDLTVDGEYGPATEAAVKKLQTKLKLTVDGKYGTQTHMAFMSALSDSVPDTETPVTPTTPIKNEMKTIAAANVRLGDSTAYGIITSLPANTVLTPILNEQGQCIASANQWYAIKCNDKIGWISGKMITIT